MTPGPVMLDVQGLELTKEEADGLHHAAVGGVILFARNYGGDVNQLRDLTAAIRQQRPDILIAVDQEGGRVQRFREGLTAIPAMARWGSSWQEDPQFALTGAKACGTVIAWELADLGLDFSFAPVLDLDHGRSAVIGTRAFHGQPQGVVALAQAMIQGLHEQGMAAVAKHFPGHGYVRMDSHVGLPVDDRSVDQIEKRDLIPFQQLANLVQAVMPAHVLYPALDSAPAGFSTVCIRDWLRQRLGFSGLVISDDLTMGGAMAWGTLEQRVCAALEAGCDALLVCNDPAAAREVLRILEARPNSLTLADRWSSLRWRSCENEAQRKAAYEEARDWLLTHIDEN